MLVLHLPEGSLGVDVPPAAVYELVQQLHALKQSWQSPIPRPEWNFVHTDPVYLELFCNPNVWPSPFAAQVLVTVQHPQVRVSAQIGLPQLLEDAASFQSQV